MLCREVALFCGQWGLSHGTADRDMSEIQTGSCLPAEVDGRVEGRTRWLRQLPGPEGPAHFDLGPFPHP